MIDKLVYCGNVLVRWMMLRTLYVLGILSPIYCYGDEALAAALAFVRC